MSKTKMVKNWPWKGLEYPVIDKELASMPLPKRNRIILETRKKRLSMGDIGL
jgi:hypothetical protein